MIVDTNPEFGAEITMVIPYAYWLHENNQLDKVVTSKGMKPFYFFCDDVEEKYESRTVDNQAAGLDSIPNNWIHGIVDYAKLYKDEWEHWEEFANVERGCGILDYRKWKMPDYVSKYKSKSIKFDKPHIVISNRYNWEHGKPPVGFFDIKCLYEIFNYLTEAGYKVIYKRPKNTEFPLDQNEMNTVMNNERLTANVDGLGVIDDFNLTEYYDDVILIDDLVDEYPDLTYNELQIRLFVDADGFISMGGGSTLFPSIFQKPIISYFGGTLSELSRECYWEDSKGNKNIKNYYYMINPNFIPFFDRNLEDKNNGYSEFINMIKSEF